MDVLVGFVKPRVSLGEDMVEWEPRDAPLGMLAGVLRGMRYDILGDTYGDVLECLDGGMGEEELYASEGWIVCCPPNLDARDVIIANDYMPHAGLVLRASELSECVEAIRRAYWQRTREYVLIRVRDVEVDPQSFPCLYSALRWSEEE